MLWCQRKYDTINDKYNEYKGQRAAFEHRSAQLKQESQTERYHKIDERVKNQLIDVQTSKMAIHDLDVYYKALDKALMHFHSIRMQAINDILREYCKCHVLEQLTCSAVRNC